MARKNNVPTLPVAGETYDIATCPWCGGAAPVFADRHGNPWCRCSECGCRAFGTKAALQLGVLNNLIEPEVQWPPSGGA